MKFLCIVTATERAISKVVQNHFLVYIPANIHQDVFKKSNIYDVTFCKNSPASRELTSPEVNTFLKDPPERLWQKTGKTVCNLFNVSSECKSVTKAVLSPNFEHFLQIIPVYLRMTFKISLFARIPERF